MLPAGIDVQPRSLLLSEHRVPDLEQTLTALPNPDLLAALDLVLLELEKRLLRYAPPPAQKEILRALQLPEPPRFLHLEPAVQSA